MKYFTKMNIFIGLYILIFFTYLFGPLVIMSITAFNSAEFPAITPWECFSFRWFYNSTKVQKPSNLILCCNIPNHSLYIDLLFNIWW